MIRHRTCWMLPAVGLALIADALRRSEMAAYRRQLARVEFSNHPFLHHGTGIDRHEALSGRDWGSGDLWALTDWAERSDAVRAKLGEIAQSAPADGLGVHAQAMLTLLGGEMSPLNTNGSFEEGTGAQATGYSYWLQDGVGKLTRSEEAASSGDFGIGAEGVQYFGPHQAVDFAPGRYCLIARLYLPEGQADGGFVELSLRALDEQNHSLPQGGTASATPVPGQWQTVATYMDVRTPPAGAVRIRAGVWARQFPAGKRIYIDDMQRIKLPDG